MNTPDPRTVRRLTEMQHKFLLAYFGDARFNATKAAVMAGYSPKTAYSIGSELLKKPHIDAVVQAWREEEKARMVKREAERLAALYRRHR
jgi:phage terminase small subunit